ncbi:MAG: L-threonylcarbamoyladenylate synthase [Acidimicrobiia bacterium]
MTEGVDWLSLEVAAEAVVQGKVVGLPTDTVYGLAVDPFAARAVASLYELKGRSGEKPISLLVASSEQAEEIAHLSPGALRLAADHWPGPLTLVVRPWMALSEWVGDPVACTVGLRVPAHPTPLRLLELVGPLAVTSANRSGHPAALDDQEARLVFGDDVAVYLAGRCPGRMASTVVDATGRELRVLRRGPVEVA